MKAFTFLKRGGLVLGMLLMLVHAEAQQVAHNLAKYWYYRNRLDFFVVPGSKPGESQIACVRNKLFEENNDMNLDYGQHGIYTGFYLGVLATEFYLLQSYGQYDAAERSRNELYLALQAFVQQMDMCEHYWGQTDRFDGFFVRENVPCAFFDPASSDGQTIYGERHVDLLNKRLSPVNHYVPSALLFDGLPRGHPGYIYYRTTCDGTQGGTPMGPPDHDHPEAMSQDEAIGMLMGLALTIKLTEGTNCKPLAVDIADRMVRYLLNLDELNGASDFRVFEPDGTMIEESRGGNTYYLAKGIIMAGEAMTGEQDYGGVDFLQNSVWSCTSWWAWSCSLSKMAAMLAAVGDSWTWTDEGLMNVTAHYNWDTFYILLWEVLHNKTMGHNEQQSLLTKALHQLNNGPCEGTYCYAPEYDYAGNPTGNPGVHSGGGWGATYKWCKEQVCQDGGDWWVGNYNGTDYMLLYNLYHIVNLGVTGFPAYIDYKNLKLSGTMPFTHSTPVGGNETGPGGEPVTVLGSVNHPAVFVGFHSVTTDQVIDVQTAPVVLQQAGHVTCKAEMSIRMTPGFHAKQGTYFHAFLEDIDCQTNTYRVESEYPEHVVDTVYDDHLSVSPEAYLLRRNSGNPHAETAYTDPSANVTAVGSSWLCSPNPLLDRLHLDYLSETNDPVTLRFFDALGTELMPPVNLPAGKGWHSVVLDVGHLSPGTIILRVDFDGRTESRVMFKQ